MTSPDDAISLKLSEIHGQYFPLSNFKKKDTHRFQLIELYQIRVEPQRFSKKEAPYRARTRVLLVWKSVRMFFI